MKSLKEMITKKALLLFAVFAIAGVMFASNKASAATTYLVKVNKQANCVTVYKMDENGKYQPVKAMICSSGYATQSGTFAMGEKIRWHTLDGPCYGQYCARIYGGVLFHSVWYYGQSNPGTLSVSSYNQLGTTCSHGCIRLTVADAKWLYDNVPTGSTVQIYADSNPGPLGKPASIKIPNNVAWDPTDIWSEGNPWNSKKPVIKAKKKVDVPFGTSYDVMSNVTATNTTGCDAKSLVKTVIKYNGAKVKKLDTSKPGMYKVIYKLKDEIGRKAKPVKSRVYVTGAEVTPVITGTHDLYIKSKSQLKPDLVKNSITVTQDSTKLDNKYITVTFKKVKKGQWKAEITAQYASKPANAYIYVYLDKQKPTISGVVNGNTYYVASMTAISKDYARSLIEVSDDITVISKDSVKIKIVNETTRVKVVYKAFDAAGRKRKVIIYFTQQQSPLVSPTPTPVSPTNQPVTGSVVSR